MDEQQTNREISVTWRGQKYVLDMNSSASLQDLGRGLLKLTAVKADTMRLIVQSHKTSKLLSPFSDEHSHLALQETSIFEAKSIRLMGVPADELDQVLLGEKLDLRIAGFDEEEKRLRQRRLNGPQASVKLPEGNYIFCDFRTLQLPGIELNPPASEALRLMHRLAADRGIVAIMNKHRWHVGVMTEMAPEGYVGVSPVCLLGFNKNHGEEISLRLRTDDLKGFRKYDSIKKTLLHELAHMVYSEHDANFYALDKQLNQEAMALDWTRSRGHTLSGATQSDYYEEEFDGSYTPSLPHKLGGSTSLDLLGNARVSSVSAAYKRLANATRDMSIASESNEDLASSSSSILPRHEHQNMDVDGNEISVVDINEENDESGHVNHKSTERKFEPDPDDEAMECETFKEVDRNGSSSEPVSHNPSETRLTSPVETESKLTRNNAEEPDPDDLENPKRNIEELKSATQIDEPEPDDQELQRIQDPVMAVCNRLQKAISMLQTEVNPSDSVAVVQTLFKIISNVIEHPDEIKFRKIRKANPVIQRNIASYKATMEILSLIGFIEDVVSDEIGRAETYLVLKRNDPGLLWLAKSSLETCIAF